MVAAQEIGQDVPLAVMANLLGGDIAGIGHGLGDGWSLVNCMQLAVAIEIGARVAKVDDEQVDADAVGDRQRGAHAEEPVIGLAALGERLSRFPGGGH